MCHLEEYADSREAVLEAGQCMSKAGLIEDTATLQEIASKYTEYVLTRIRKEIKSGTRFIKEKEN